MGPKDGEVSPRRVPVLHEVDEAAELLDRDVVVGARHALEDVEVLLVALLEIYVRDVRDVRVVGLI